VGAAGAGPCDEDRATFYWRVEQLTASPARVGKSVRREEFGN
jgi:hypothetical protein